MITQEQQKQGAELMTTLVQKAWESVSFKEQLIQNPISAIESVTKKELNKDFKVLVEDQTDESVVYLNIPRRLNYSNIELTDEQLEIVSGGETVIAGSVLVLTALMAGIMVGEKLK